MNWYRIRHTLGMLLTASPRGRADYIKKHHIFKHMGEKSSVMFRKLPLYPKLISIGNNVRLAANVLLVTHDGIHRMLNNAGGYGQFQEMLGCIEIQDNVFIGSNTTILPNVTIGPNTVIAAGSLVNKSLPGNGVYGGVPAKYIGSFEKLVEKRRDIPKIEIEYNNTSGLSDETVEEIWQRYYSTRPGGKQNES